MKINPHCHVCKEKLNVGQDVVMDSIFKGIIHTECSNLPIDEIEDRGKLEEVVSRNQEWLKWLNPLIVH